MYVFRADIRLVLSILKSKTTIDRVYEGVGYVSCGIYFMYIIRLAGSIKTQKY